MSLILPPGIGSIKTPEFVQANGSGISDSLTNTAFFDPNQLPESGSMLWAYSSYDNSWSDHSPQMSITDDQKNRWYRATYVFDTHYSWMMELWVAPGAAGGQTYVTAYWGGQANVGSRTLWVGAFRNVDQRLAVDQSAGACGMPPTPVNCPLIYPTCDKQLIMGVTFGTTNYVPPPGFVLTYSDSGYLNVFHTVQASAVPVAFNPTYTSGDVWAVAVASFRPRIF